MNSLYNYSYEKIQDLCEELGYKKFHGKQIFRWLYRERVENIDEMTNISKEAREELKKNYEIGCLKVEKHQISKDGTVKYLFRLDDGSLIETVLMQFDYGKSVCVTSQVGCNMGCKFCASGIFKKQRNLEISEMVAQIMYIQKELDKEDDRISHIVVMGTGEPFDNYDNVMEFLSIVNNDNGLAISARHITVSTCGIVPKIIEFSKAKYQYNLAISLHAANDKLRNELMPINKVYDLEKLMDALFEYEKLNNRRLTFEYILLKGVNDSEKDAKQLSRLLKGHHYYINLIPYNSVDEKIFKNVNRDETMRFYDKLMKLGVRCTIRKEHGNDIDAACGQLRAKVIKGDIK